MHSWNNLIIQQIKNQSERIPFSHLTLKDRQLIEKFLNLHYVKNYNGPKITASRVRCSKSTVSREIKKGLYKKSWDSQSAPSFRYAYDVAQRVSDSNAKRSHYTKKVHSDNIDI